ncbi:MAG: UDP-glucose 4-epimerase GalE [Deltaproteobacteria bacterium]|nr:UDP-glucose 4-epimerase GalE [Deltaproteobacteria bacterium]
MTDTVLVTGGAGYIGSHTCKALAALGYLPVSLDNLIYGHTWAVQWGPLITGDITDALILDQVFSQYRPKAVIHFAAFAYVGESVDHPAKYYQNNVVGSLAILDAMRRHGCRNIIFSSSCATYGIPEEVPIPENHPQLPINPYGRSKLMMEQIIQDYGSAYGISYAILRYFNAAGADPEGQIGEDHDPETHLIPILLQTVLGQRSHTDVYGTDYDTPDGTAIRDYIHVTDLARAHVLALKYLTESQQSLCINLGTGHGYSVMEVIQAVQQVTGKPVTYRTVGRRPGDPPALLAKSERADSLLDWKPDFSDILATILTAWNWCLSQSAKKNLKQP